MLKELHYCTRLFSSKNDFDDFVSLIVGTLIVLIIDISSSILNFELKGVIYSIGIVLIELCIEKLLKDDGLIVSKCEVFTSSE